MKQRFCILAFWILYRRISEDLARQCSELSELLTDAIDIRANRVKWGIIVEDMVDALESA